MSNRRSDRLASKKETVSNYETSVNSDGGSSGTHCGVTQPLESAKNGND